ncbi:hypothetical protein ACFQ1I_24555 [Kitasatospora arboriphila]
MQAAAWDLRVARAVPFALVCTLVAAAGHAAVGGGDVALPALAAGFAAVVLLAAALGGRERSLGAITAALGAGQLGLHLLFHTLTPARAHHMAGMSMPEAAGRLLCDDMPGNGVTRLPAGTSPEQLISDAGLDPHAYAAAGAGHAASGLFGTGPAMLLGHLAAAVVVELVAAAWRGRAVAAGEAHRGGGPRVVRPAAPCGGDARRRPARGARGRAGRAPPPGRGRPAARGGRPGAQPGAARAARGGVRALTARHGPWRALRPDRTDAERPSPAPPPSPAHPCGPVAAVRPAPLGEPIMRTTPARRTALAAAVAGAAVVALAGQPPPTSPSSRAASRRAATPPWRSGCRTRVTPPPP